MYESGQLDGDQEEFERLNATELPEVWCVNDASNAVVMIDGKALCATCSVPAYAEAVRAARA